VMFRYFIPAIKGLCARRWSLNDKGVFHVLIEESKLGYGCQMIAY
jgi:hypothetical protein